jgi:hypothetical protein
MTEPMVAYSSKHKKKVPFKYFCIDNLGKRLVLRGEDEDGRRLVCFGSKQKIEEYKQYPNWNGIYIDEKTQVVEDDGDTPDKK